MRTCRDRPLKPGGRGLRDSRRPATGLAPSVTTEASSPSCDGRPKPICAKLTARGIHGHALAEHLSIATALQRRLLLGSSWPSGRPQSSVTGKCEAGRSESRRGAKQRVHVDEPSRQSQHCRNQAISAGNSAPRRSRDVDRALREYRKLTLEAAKFVGKSCATKPKTRG